MAQLKDLFLVEATRNKALPIGGGLWIPAFHPEMRISPPYTEWRFSGDTVRMPEFCAPSLGNKPNLVSLEVDVPEHASGVLYKLGGAGGGLTLFMDDGHLCFEYNLFIVLRTKFRSAEPLTPGSGTIEVRTEFVERRPGGPLQITITWNGDKVVEGNVPVSVPLLFTANDCLDFGIAHGSPVSMDYYDRMPFAFTGTLHRAHVTYLDAPA